MPVIGFRAGDEKAKPPKFAPDAEVLPRFDSDRAISFKDAERRAGVFGSNGTGETARGAVPAMSAAIKSGAMTVIIDPKGTLARYARAIAQACGSGDDII